MDSSRSQSDVGTDFVRQAESLIRSLAGVVHARIQATTGGIDAIHVIATDDLAAASMAAHVRSALLAGLATPIVPARIHVRTDDATPRPPANGAAAASAGEGPRTAPRDRLRLIHDVAEAVEEMDGEEAPGPRGDAAGRGDAADAGDAAARQPATPTVARARLVAVDVRRPGDGRIVCRVSVAWNGQVHRAEAVAMDLPGAAAQAAAQAAVRALASAGLPGLELSGLREVEIAGRDYVLVALRRHDGPAVRHRSGSALMFGTPERSAAEATVDAVNELI